MNKDEIMQQIADEIKRTFKEEYLKPFPSEEEMQQAIKQKAKPYIDLLKKRLTEQGYIIKTPKLPRKLKKYYKKTVGSLPVEISINCVECYRGWTSGKFSS